MSLLHTVCRRVKTRQKPGPQREEDYNMGASYPGCWSLVSESLGTQVIFYQKGNASPIQGCTHREQALQKCFSTNHTCNEGHRHRHPDQRGTLTRWPGDLGSGDQHGKYDQDHRETETTDRPAKRIIYTHIKELRMLCTCTELAKTSSNDQMLVAV